MIMLNTVYVSPGTRVIDIIANIKQLGGSIRSEHGHLIATLNGIDTMLDTYPDSALINEPIH